MILVTDQIDDGFSFISSKTGVIGNPNGMISKLSEVVSEKSDISWSLMNKFIFCTWRSLTDNMGIKKNYRDVLENDITR